MPLPSENDRVVANRRRQLQRWIDDKFGGIKVDFIASTNDGEKQINQGELSALLKTKSFGEKRARSLERQAQMPERYLESSLSPKEALSLASPIGLNDPGPVANVAAYKQLSWPFKLVSHRRLEDLQKSLGARRAAQALSDIDNQLELVVMKWERELDGRKSSAR